MGVHLFVHMQNFCVLIYKKLPRQSVFRRNWILRENYFLYVEKREMP